MVLLAKGPEYMQYPKVKKPHLECAHTTQSRMLADLTESIGRSYILWKTQEPSNEETENFDDLHQHFQTAHIERLLAAEMVKCPSCASKRKPPSTGGKEASDGSEECPESSSTDKEQDDEHLESPLMDGSQSPGLPEIYPNLFIIALLIVVWLIYIYIQNCQLHKLTGMMPLTRI